MMQEIRVPRWPVAVNNSLNRHWSTAFISIELEIPPVTLNTTLMLPWNETLSAELDCSFLNAQSWNQIKEIKHIVERRAIVCNN